MTFPTTPVSHSSGLCYGVSASGHRQQYSELFAAELALEPILAPMTAQIFRRLIRADRALFLTLDDDLKGFALVAIARALRRRRTVGLFLRPRETLEKWSLKGRIKNVLYRCLKSEPNIRVLTILPFWIEPRFERIADGWIYDLQFWDLEGGTRPVSAVVSIAGDALTEARGRQIVVALGRQSRGKGFIEFVDFWTSSAELRKKYLFVVAGGVAPECEAAAKAFAASDGFLVSRYIDDAEIYALYDIADLMWCCYAPNYDQASGIFGRALQFSVPAIVREGSMIHGIANRIGFPVIPLPFSQPENWLTILNQQATTGPNRINPNIAEMKRMSLQTLGQALSA